MRQFIKQNLISLLISFFLFTQSYGQMKYLGLKQESNVRIAQQKLAGSGTYWPKMQIIDDNIYVSTINGIYSKQISSTNDTLWNSYAFQGVPVRNFVKHNDSLLAITSKTNDSLMLLSIDNGNTYVNHTSEFFFKYKEVNTIWSVSMNPLNFNSLVVLHNGYGVAKSIDFGNTWSSLKEWAGGYQDRFVGFNRNDSTNILYVGEQMFEESYTQVTYDNGNTWILTNNIPSHCNHVLAFHPTNPDIILSGEEGRIAKSFDRGRNWITKGQFKEYIYSVVFDENNPNILFACGNFIGIDDTIRIYKSIDCGDNWSLYCGNVIPNSDGIVDMQINKNKLILYTMVNGIYMLDLDVTNSINVTENGMEFILYPNPSNSIISCNCNETINFVRLIDSSGKLLKVIIPHSKGFVLDISSFSKGIYMSLFETNDKIIYKKIIKE